MDDEQNQRRRRRRRSDRDVNSAAPVRLARLVRSPSAQAAAMEPAVVIELGEVRVSVAAGAEPGLVATVLALIGGAR